jgi:hypothetical protein
MGDDILNLTAASSLAATDMMYGVVNVATTPLDRKVTVAVVQAATQGGVALTWPVANAAGALTNDGSGVLSWAAAGGGASAIDDLTDVVITAAATGDILRFNGTNWVDYPDSNYAAAGHDHAGVYQPTNATLDSVAAGTYAGDDSIVTVGTLSAGSVPWSLLSSVPLTFAPAAHTIGSHSDITITTQALGDLVYASAGNAWVNLAGNITATKKFLRQTGNGSISAAPAWDTVTATDVGLGSVENTALSTWAGSTSIVTLGTVTTGSFPYANLSGTPGTFAPAAHTLDSHSNVTITANSDGEIVRWNGSAWVNNTLAEAGISAVGHDHSGVYEPVFTTLGYAKGGTDQSSYAAGDLLYASAINTLAKRTIGNVGDVLTVAGGVPTWAAPAAGSSSFTTKIETLLTTEQFRLSYDAGNYFTAVIDATGNASLTATGYVSIAGMRVGVLTTDNYILSDHSLASASGAIGNVAIGKDAARSITSADYAVAIGYEAMRSATTNSGLVAVGYQAFYSQSSSEGVAVGFEAGQFSTGRYSTFVGYKCGANLTTGAENTAVGHTALLGAATSTASKNVAVGMNTLAGAGTGATGNLALGYKLVETAFTGSYGIFLGYDFDPASATADYQLNLGGFLKSDDYRTSSVSLTNATNGQALGIKVATAAVTGMSGATVTATNLIPAGATVLGVTVRVTTLIASGDGGTTFTIGDGTDADAWGTGIAFAAGTVTSGTAFTVTTPLHYAAATSVVLTCTGGTFNAGAARITVHYLDYTAATS